MFSSVVRLLAAEDVFTGPKAHHKSQYYAIPALAVTTALGISPDVHDKFNMEPKLAV